MKIERATDKDLKTRAEILRTIYTRGAEQCRQQESDHRHAALTAELEAERLQREGQDTTQERAGIERHRQIAAEYSRAAATLEAQAEEVNQ